ncbi:hypothetical protein EBU95_16860 [bacterium]|nr:hypothetical protein [bacterium]
MLSKQEFFIRMSVMYEEKYNDEDAYKVFKQIVKMHDDYRHSLAANGKELTPRQLDQYISTIQLALEQRI